MILPRYQSIKGDILDGLRAFEDIAHPDSAGRTFYALVDRSYVLVEEGAENLFGGARRIRDGICRRVSERGQWAHLNAL